MLHRRTFLGGVTAATAIASELHAQSAGGRFVGSLVLQPLKQGRLMRLQNAFSYLGGNGVAWPVPAQAVVDGASIPQVFWSLVGGPWDGTYREASVIHDWYCAVRTMPWKDTHRMFYEAMLTSGVEWKKARLMFLAVRYAGPSWDDLTLENSRLLTQNGKKRLDPPGVPKTGSSFASDAEAKDARAALFKQFDRLKDQVDQGDLALADVESLVDATGRAEDTAAMLEAY